MYIAGSVFQPSAIVCILLIFYAFLLTEPASSPQNVMAVAMSSTEIMVTWEDVPMIDRNGIIINYEIQIEPLDFLADIFIDPLNTTNLSILVADLEEHVFYDIRVRAYTSVGPGPYSDPVTVRTFEDGNVHICFSLCFWI